jgi:hypothetical protein
MSLSDDILVHAMRYDLVGKNRRLFLPETLAAVARLTEVDRLNVCDSRDEVDHDYRFSSRLGGIPLTGAARIDAYLLPGGIPERVIDGGRAILGEESFRVHAIPGRDLTLVMRTAQTLLAGARRASGSGTVSVDIPDASVSVAIGDSVVASESFRPRRGWDERVLRVPAAALRQEEPRFHVRGRFASFYYWFYQ